MKLVMVIVLRLADGEGLKAKRVFAAMKDMGKIGIAKIEAVLRG